MYLHGKKKKFIREMESQGQIWESRTQEDGDVEGGWRRGTVKEAAGRGGGGIETEKTAFHAEWISSRDIVYILIFCSNYFTLLLSLKVRCLEIMFPCFRSSHLIHSPAQMYCGSHPGHNYAFTKVAYVFQLLHCRCYHGWQTLEALGKAGPTVCGEALPSGLLQLPPACFFLSGHCISPSFTALLPLFLLNDGISEGFFFRTSLSQESFPVWSHSCPWPWPSL